MLDRFADKLTGIARNSNSVLSPILHISKPAVGSPDHVKYKREVFGLGGHVCEQCHMINPVIFTLSPLKVPKTSGPPLFVPCSHNGSDKPEVEQRVYNEELNKYGYVSPLKDWIAIIWSNPRIMKILALNVPDPKYRDKLSNAVAATRYTLKVNFNEKDSLGNTHKKIINLSYDDTVVEDTT